MQMKTTRLSQARPTKDESSFPDQDRAPFDIFDSHSQQYREDRGIALQLDVSPVGAETVEETVPTRRLPFAIEELLAATTIIVLVLITLANVIARYLLHASFAFTEEYSSVLLLCMVFVTTSAAMAKNTHIRMTFLADRISPRNQERATIFGSAAVIVCFGIVVYYGSLMCWDAYRFGETSPGMGHPMWVYLIWLPLLSLLTIVRAIGVLVRVRVIQSS
jgi:TRAP-type C4-dicarboxylate transport system permease small subunit